MASNDLDSYSGVYHIWCRGTDKRNIFIDNNDRSRFLASLHYFNSVDPVEIRKLDRVKMMNARISRRDRLVYLLSYTMLDNHFHIAVQTSEEHGLTLFLKKLGIGYTHYFNKRHDRKGRLFESRLNYKPMLNDEQLWHLIAYIHLNVLDKRGKAWRSSEQQTPWSEVRRYMLGYKWSSAQFYLDGKIDDEPLLDKSAIQELIGKKGIQEQELYMKGWCRRGLPYYMQADIP
jgi:putative transposase